MMFLRNFKEQISIQRLICQLKAYLYRNPLYPIGYVPVSPKELFDSTFITKNLKPALILKAQSIQIPASRSRYRDSEQNGGK